MSPALTPEQVKEIERIMGKLLYYTRGLDNLCLVSLRKTATIIDPIEQDGEKCTPIFELHGNIYKCSGQISRFRHDFLRLQQIIISD